MFTKILTNYSECFQTFNHSDEGFHTKSSTTHQLQIVIATLKDAKISQEYILLLKLNLKNAFGSIDRSRLFANI